MTSDTLRIRFGGNTSDLTAGQVCDLLVQLKDGDLRQRIIERLDTDPRLFSGAWRQTIDSLAHAPA